MPLYEYRCSDCNISFTELRSFSEKDSQIDCPKCECIETKLSLSSFSVRGGDNFASSGCSSSTSQFT